MDNYRREEITKKIKELTLTLKEHDEHIKTVQESAFRLANFYFAFQGVILSSVLSSSLQCSDLWIIVVLCLSVAILDLVGFLRTGFRLIRAMRIKEEDADQCGFLKVSLQNNQDPGLGNASIGTVNHKYEIILWACVAFFVLFTSFIILAARWKICRKI